MGKYYVYAYLNPLKKGMYRFGKYEFANEPFYIGKGKNKRCFIHQNYPLIGNNLYLKNIIANIKQNNMKPIIVYLKTNMSENKALLLERSYIKTIGRKNIKTGPLTNLTDGGEGTSGYIHTIGSREKMGNPIAVSQLDNNGKLVKYWKSHIAASTYLSVSSNHILRCTRELNRQCANFYWRTGYVDNITISDKNIPVLQVNLNGEIIRKFANAQEAYLLTGIKVLHCCKLNHSNPNKFKRYGYMWFFITDKQYINKYLEHRSSIRSRPFFKIQRIDINTNDVISEYYNRQDILNAGYVLKLIYMCVDGKLKTTQGYKWAIIK